MEKIEHNSMDTVAQKFQATAYQIPRISDEYRHLRQRFEELADDDVYIKGLYVDTDVVDKSGPIEGAIMGRPFKITLEYVLREDETYGKCLVLMKDVVSEKFVVLDSFMINKDANYLYPDLKPFYTYMDTVYQTTMVMSIIKAVAEAE